MSAFGSRRNQRYVATGDVTLPPQDQCMMPVLDPTPFMRDMVTLKQWAPRNGASVVDDGGTPAYVGYEQGDYCQIDDGTTPIKTWASGFTVLVRAWGTASDDNSFSLWGDVGQSGNRGTGAGPNRDGAAGMILATSSTGIVLTDFPIMFASDGVYHDYAFIFKPSEGLECLKDNVLMASLYSGVPAQRYIGNAQNVVLGNRGDLTGGGSDDSYFIGRVRFLFFYKQVLSPEIMQAVFDNPIYVPGGG